MLSVLPWKQSCMNNGRFPLSSLHQLREPQFGGWQKGRSCLLFIFGGQA